MKHCHSVLVALLIVALCRADELPKTADAEPFVHQLVLSLLDDRHPINFPVADPVFAMDTGQLLTKAEFEKAWPSLGKEAFKTKVSAEQFFRDVSLRVSSALDNKRLLSNKRLMQAYTPQVGDLYCDASQVKAGVDDFIAYKKAFLFIIRNLDGKWTLIGIGG